MKPIGPILLCGELSELQGVEFNNALQLLEPAIPNKADGPWADLGCGEGLFTAALSHLMGAQSTLYAVDLDARAMKKIEVSEEIQLIKIVANFEKDDLQLKDLDGILMTNALHFVKDKSTFIRKAQSYLKTDGRYVIVEYDTDIANRWVPYPISFTTCQDLFTSLGFVVTKIGEQASIYNNAGMYAVEIRPF